MFLFVDRKPVGIIEEGRGRHRLTVVEEQSSVCNAKLKYLNNDSLPFVYEH
jgi:type I restriction enzyme R subunit